MKIQVLHNAVFALFIIHLISFVNLNAQEFSFEPPQVQKVRLKTVPRISSDEIDPSAIVGGSTPEDFINFMNSASPPDYSSDATYSIKLADIEAGGGLDYPCEDENIIPGFAIYATVFSAIIGAIFHSKKIDR